MEKENNSSLIVIIIVLLLAIIGLCIYVVYDKTKDIKPQSNNTQTNTDTNKEQEKKVPTDEEVAQKTKEEIEKTNILTDQSEKVLYLYLSEVSDTELPSTQRKLNGEYNCKNDNCYGKAIRSTNNLYSITDGENLEIYDVEENKIVLSIKNPSTDNVKTYIEEPLYVGNYDINRTIVGLIISREDKYKTSADQSIPSNLVAYYDLRNNKYVTDFKYTNISFIDGRTVQDTAESHLIVAKNGADYSDGYAIIGDKHLILDIINVDSGKVLYHSEADLENNRQWPNVYKDNNVYAIVMANKVDILNSDFEYIAKDLNRHVNGTGDPISAKPVVFQNGNVLVVVDNHFVIYDQKGNQIKVSKDYEYVDIVESNTFKEDAFVVVKEGNNIKILDSNETFHAAFEQVDSNIKIKRIELLEKDTVFKSESGSDKPGVYVYAAADNRAMFVYYYDPEGNDTSIDEREWFLQI